MKLVHEHRVGTPARPVHLICVFRDEALLMPHFVEHYRRLGVTHFVMVDNGSEDGGPDLLRRIRDVSVTLYRTEDDYRAAALGTDWVNRMLREHCVGQHCFTVDVDELFRFDEARYEDLQVLLDEMEGEGSNAVAATLLDMYPASPDERYEAGQSFLSHSPWFDEPNDAHYRRGRLIYGRFHHRAGGFRRRFFGVDACIHKFPLICFDFDPTGVAVGYHFFREDGAAVRRSDRIRVHGHSAVLLHFKLLRPDLASFYEARAELAASPADLNALSAEANEYWAAENESYRLRLAAGPDTFLDPRYSRRLRDARDLAPFFEAL